MKIKKLVIITHHFWPENFLINEIALKFEKKGIQTTVITGLPNYPKGEVFTKYKKVKTLKIEKFRGIDIIRFPIIPRKKGKFINLVLNYFSYLINGFFFLNRLNLGDKFHHIFIYSTSPITTALLGVYLKKKYKKKITLWVQDLWPDSVKNTGFIKNRFLLYLISLIVKFIYKQSDNIVVQSKAFKKNIIKYTRKKIKIVENSHFNIENRNYKIPKKIKNLLNNNFCITFAGNIGKAQSIETILEASKQIRNKKKIHIILIGSGSEAEKTKIFIKKNKLSNISIFGPYPSGLAFKIIKNSNATLLTLKKSLIFSQTIPNKFQTYLFAKRPIIVSANGEVARLTKIKNVGLVSASENSKKLAGNIIKISKFKSFQFKKIQRNCINFYNSSYNINGQVQKLINIMNND